MSYIYRSKKVDILHVFSPLMIGITPIFGKNPKKWPLRKPDVTPSSTTVVSTAPQPFWGPPCVHRRWLWIEANGNIYETPLEYDDKNI